MKQAVLFSNRPSSFVCQGIVRLGFREESQHIIFFSIAEWKGSEQSLTELSTLRKKHPLPVSLSVPSY